MAKEELARGDRKAAAAYYRETIAMTPNYWRSYSALGKMMFEFGEIHEASKLFLLIPVSRKIQMRTGY